MGWKRRNCARAGAVAVAVAALLPPSANAEPGSLDRSFGLSGLVTASVSGDRGAQEAPSGVARLADGRIVVTGTSDDAAVVVRFLPDGRRDPAFGFGGAARVPVDGFVPTSVAVAPDGRIVLAGALLTDARGSGSSDAAIAVFNPDGRVSGAFGPAGVQALDFQGSADVVSSVAVDPSGRIVAAGTAGRVAFLSRLLPDGRRDPSFGVDGVRTSDLGGEIDSWEGLVLDGDAPVVLGVGASEDSLRPLLARFTPAGQPDTAFGSGGRVELSRVDELPAGLARAGDGRLVAGFVDETGFGVRRFTSTGRPDASFGGGGVVRGVIVEDALPGGLAVAPDGAVVITADVLVGDESAVPFVARLRSDGGLDTGFGCGGSTYLDNREDPQVVGPVVVEPDGRIVVVGARIRPSGPEVESDLLVARLDGGGTSPSGYRLASSAGAVEAFGDAGACPSLTTVALTSPIVAIASPPGSDDAAFLAAADGGVFATGSAVFRGSLGGRRLNQPIVGMAADPDGSGYWLVARDGGVFAFDAPFLGSAGGRPLNAPIVGIAATPTGRGYRLVASDGGVFAFGDAGFLGSTGGRRLNQPVVGLASTRTGAGYWLVASDGGIFAFGDAPFVGSTGGRRLNQPIVGMAADPDGGGYWLAARDGGIFAFDAPFLGSVGSRPPESPVVGVAATP